MRANATEKSTEKGDSPLEGQDRAHWCPDEQRRGRDQIAVS